MTRDHDWQGSRRARRVAFAFALVLAAAATLVLVDGAARAQDGGGGPRCTRCKSLGRVACKDHNDAAELELGALYCSETDGCALCGGAGWLDCDDCANEPAEAWLASRRASQERLRVELASLDLEMGRRLCKAKSRHFVLVWDIESLKVDKRRLDAHALLHLYLGRLESLFADYCALLGAGEGEFAKDLRVFVWSLPKDQLEASLRFCSQGNERGVKLLGATPAYSVCGARQFYRGDEELHRNLVHSVSHLLLSHQTPADWIGNKKGGWADEGLAHLFEERAFGLCDNYCYQEQDTNRDFKGGKWKPAVRKMVALGELPPVATVFEQNTDTLTLEQHAVAFSYVDYLVAHDGAKANRLFRRMRARTPTRDALEEAFGWTPLEFEEVWKAWVLATYPAR